MDQPWGTHKLAGFQDIQPIHSWGTTNLTHTHSGIRSLAPRYEPHPLGTELRQGPTSESPGCLYQKSVEVVKPMMVSVMEDPYFANSGYQNQGCNKVDGIQSTTLPPRKWEPVHPWYPVFFGSKIDVELYVSSTLSPAGA